MISSFPKCSFCVDYMDWSRKQLQPFSIHNVDSHDSLLIHEKCGFKLQYEAEYNGNYNKPNLVHSVAFTLLS